MHAPWWFVVAGSLVAAVAAPAATPQEIDDAVRKGAASLRQQYTRADAAEVVDGVYGIGPPALAGLALLEVGTPAADEAIRTIAAAVREAALSEVRTYQITLCILFLDRLGESADNPLIQLLAVRLVAGQTGRGGWTYSCTAPVSAADLTRLRAAFQMRELRAGGGGPPAPAGKASTKPTGVGTLHPAVKAYAARLAAEQRRPMVDDNSNTQFGILGVWVARRHGVDVEAVLGQIETRFLTTQTATGGWPYTDSMPGTPSMTCAGLLGLATAVARREERLLKATPVRSPRPAPKVAPVEPDEPAEKGTGLFFNPPKAPEPNPPVKPPAPPPAKKRVPPADAREVAIRRAFDSLAAVLAGKPGGGRGNAGGLLAGGRLGDRDFYFLWSLERVGVLYDIDRIGDTEWYPLGADALVRTQHATGGWGPPPHGSPVDTAFALLFLRRSNLVSDLSARVQRKGLGAELRAGSPPAETPPLASAVGPASAAPAPAPRADVGGDAVGSKTPPKPLVAPVWDAETKTLAAALIDATDANWETVLSSYRDSQGGGSTQALALAAERLAGARREAVRTALAKRLTRMAPDTLRTLAKAESAELRRCAVLAMAMKRDQSHLSDLVAALADEQVLVLRAARASLVALSGQDFGPDATATAAQRTAAIRAWSDWLAKQKK